MIYMIPSRLLVLWIALAARPLDAQLHARPHPLPTATLVAVPRIGEIVIDGRLVESAWSRAGAADHFTQVMPNEGQPATQRTEVRILFDASYVYFGARMFD